MRTEGPSDAYLSASETQRRPEGGITRLNAGGFGTDTRTAIPRTQTLRGGVRPATLEEIVMVQRGFLHRPTDGPAEDRQGEFADTGPEGLGVAPKPKKQGKSRREHPERRDRGHRSFQGNGNEEHQRDRSVPGAFGRRR